MKKIFSNLLDLFYPSLCVVCDGRLTEKEQHLCLECLSQLPKTNQHLHPNNRLEEFFAGRIPFQRIAAYSYFVKEGSVQKIIHELKYKNNPKIGYYIGQLCGEHLKSSDFISNIDLLVPIPLHPKREKKRGYNQSMEICKGISDKTGIAVNNSSLKRMVNNKSQTQNSRFNRWNNVENIFSLSGKEELEQKHILLVDDVITTGSTIESAIRTILNSVDCQISIYAVGMAT